jgi:hypothetical protein
VIADQNLLLRLTFLLRVVQKESYHLSATDARIFVEPFTLSLAEELTEDVELSERIDAFVSRFGRLQDTLGDKVLPSLLKLLGERPGAFVDNLDRAERLGWIDSVDEWMSMRQLRNQMVHEYIEDLQILTDALNAAHDFVPNLLLCAERIRKEFERRSS